MISIDMVHETSHALHWGKHCTASRKLCRGWIFFFPQANRKNTMLSEATVIVCLYELL